MPTASNDHEPAPDLRAEAEKIESDANGQSPEGVEAFAPAAAGAAGGARKRPERRPDDSARSSRRRLARSLARSLVAVLVGSLVLRVAAQTMGQMLQFYLAEIDRSYYAISHEARGFITASFFVTELLGSLVLGAMSDRYGRKLFIVLGPLFGAVAVQMTSMTVAIWLLVITRLLEGLSTASAIPATLGYISEATTKRPSLRARIVGLFEITLVGGIALGAVVGGYLWENFGKPAEVAGLRLISPAFSINGLIYLISLAIFAWGLSDIKRRPDRAAPRHGMQHKLGRYREVLKSPHVWKFVPAWLAVNSILGLWINHSVGLMTGKDHYDDQLFTGNIAADKFGYVFGILAVVFALGLLAWSLILGRYRKTSVMIVSTGGLFITLITVYGLNHLGTFSHPLYYPLLGGLVVGLVVLSGFTPAALTYLADVTESHREDRGTIMGLYSVFLGVGQVIGTTVGGFFATAAGIDGLLLLSAILGVIMVFTLVALRNQERAAR
jgi:MFS family permease